MTNLAQRGWDLPGGHVEPGETPEQAMRREVFEETGAHLGAVQVLGYQQIRLLGVVPIGYRYPYSDSYQVFYVGQIAGLEPYGGSSKASERRLFAPVDAAALRWVQEHQAFYEAALKRIQQLASISGTRPLDETG